MQITFLNKGSYTLVPAQDEHRQKVLAAVEAGQRLKMSVTREAPFTGSDRPITFEVKKVDAYQIIPTKLNKEEILRALAGVSASNPCWVTIKG